MRAAISRGRRALLVEDVSLPEPGPGEVRVRVTACGVCGTDLHLFHAGLLPVGLTPGHEIAGTVDRTGPGVSNFASGDPIVVEPLRTCGQCRECRAGRDSICSEMRLLGLHESGGMAEYVVVPAHRLFRVPRGLDPRIAALAEPVAVVLHGLRRAGFAAGQRVLVLGAGTVGLLGVLAARALGAGEVWLAARHPHQADLGRALGATRVLTEAEATPAALASQAKSALADLVLETVGGKADTLRAAGAALAPGGSVSVLGVFLGTVQLDPYPLLLKEATLAWSNCYARSWQGSPRADFEDAVALVDGQRELLARLVTHSVPLGEVERGFEIASDKKAGAVKVSVLPTP
jgi:2-desacetyl-2-hydroxyethyl bacteriochlorophyllide A dehydrogenase